MSKTIENIIAVFISIILSSTVFFTMFYPFLKEDSFGFFLDSVSSENILIEKKDVCVYEKMKKYLDKDSFILSYIDLSNIKDNCQEAIKKSVAFEEQSIAFKKRK